MSETLSLKRLYMFTARHWFENRKLYGLFFLAITVFMMGWFVFYILVGNPYLFVAGSQLTVYFAGLFISGCLSAAFLFRDLSSRQKKISYYMIPAAALEKVLCALFYGVLLFFIGYSTIFYVTDFFAVKIANSAVADMMNSKSLNAMQWRQQFGINAGMAPARPVNVFAPSTGEFVFYPGDTPLLFGAFFPMQSAFILGSLYFAKNSLFKTIVVLLGLFMLFFIIEARVIMPMFPGQSETLNTFTIIRAFNTAGDAKTYALPFWIGEVAGFLVKFAITPVMWVAIYYRLKENEI